MSKFFSKEPGSAVPSSRSSRLFSMAGLAAGIAGNVVTEYAKHISHGNSPELKEILLTPGNAKRLADKLKKMRGAALKVGQLLSMDSGDFIPAELAVILDKLRDDVEPMPFSQLTALLHQEWGENWHEKFAQFSFTPMAAASIGQVHSAHNLNHERLAIKIQYPGVSQSINSDVDNVGTILKYSGLLPDASKIENLLAETKQQLHVETDYLSEAAWIDKYRHALADDDRFIVPSVYEEFTKPNILCMSFHEGGNIDSYTALSQEERNHIAASLMSLTFREVFELHHVQTDPNFANYLYQPEDKKIVLLDFGATRELPSHIAKGYQQLINGSVKKNKETIDQAIELIGFFQEEISPKQKLAVTELFYMACEPLHHAGEYDFGNSDLAKRISIAGSELSLKKNYWHTPPADALFLHRKLAGLYLIAAKLKAKINIQDLIHPYIK
jgi:predicted unusual protein kinase regulating ubiquinone biosynthesis (AarF/ABC1/UbiB family)